MLSKNHRIRKKKDIEKIFKEGKNFRENSLVLKTVKNDLNAYRFGFIVSQKISKKANIRNKIKRRLREIVRLRMKSPEANTDNLFIALPGLEKKEFKQLEETIEKLFKKAKINVQ
ncbi:MAG: ribonuclease P protein component [Candidatus Nealsonbacteria bacterium CG02_land_8_20_14_3_00_37_10]|uniref:Ribonuclease P protein component n=1 Tax=Candidatus Nealsonbacteria bacterium CG02_land_8_20_14_3_00_37_10 TaxID=1974699 RepID=A0A2M7DA51_9BACT|nr:MAG: ribonuclease P protein component [Candidatus Nealsonbacteria bacterium CG02_land_8_20_14_3_00_37_10]